MMCPFSPTFSTPKVDYPPKEFHLEAVPDYFFFEPAGSASPQGEIKGNKQK
jgi:hypothetical protein